MIIHFRRALAGLFPPRRKRCVLCGKRLSWFLPYRNGVASVPALIRELDLIGSDVSNFTCPWCFSHDRERHLFLYMQATGFLPDLDGRDVLHFAPEARLSRVIASAGTSRYVRCDLHPVEADVVHVDILAIPFADESFDLVIANHVLEHVADDRKALSEIRRVLRKDGSAILQTPYCNRLHHTWEDPGIDDDRARLQACGQEDHVRLYGRDIFQRFAACGLAPRIRQHADLLGDIDVVSLGVNPREPFMMFQRPD